MGLILDTSVLIGAERQGLTVEGFLEQIEQRFGDTNLALSALSVPELVHGIFRARTSEIQERREEFVEELLRDVPVYPFTVEIGRLAGRLDAEAEQRGQKVPYGDLLIGATALALQYDVLTINVRHFEQIPRLVVQAL
ncbi:MAG: PIN domain-containing protein [Acidobacteria bacterium]|nr:PIN domain-containing protein [Acidobacteriota bacterium]